MLKSTYRTEQQKTKQHDTTQSRTAHDKLLSIKHRRTKVILHILADQRHM